MCLYAVGFGLKMSSGDGHPPRFLFRWNINMVDIERYIRAFKRRRDCSWVFQTAAPGWPRSLGPCVGSAALSSPPRNTLRWSRACSAVPTFCATSRRPIAVQPAIRRTVPVSRRHRRGCSSRRRRRRRRPDHDAKTTRRGSRLPWSDVSPANRRSCRGSCCCCRHGCRWSLVRPVGASVRKSVDDDGPTVTHPQRSDVPLAAIWCSRGLRSVVSCTI